MSDLATYGSAIAPFFPFKILPETGDMITWDWMDSIGQFQQRYIKMATIVATHSHGEIKEYNYGALRCDFFPPYIKVYVYDFVNSFWEIYSPYSDPLGVDQNVTKRKTYAIYDVGLGTCQIRSNLNQTRVFMLLAYL
jgi:hypothetical protein